MRSTASSTASALIIAAGHASTLHTATRRRGGARPGSRFGWDGAFSTSLYVDPHEEMVGVLMAQCRPGALRLPPFVLDFWTSAYQAIDPVAPDKDWLHK
jgi:CubicO group peptidase (beta-lactamase class C family)